jgi:hypothetical protein
MTEALRAKWIRAVKVELLFAKARIQSEALLKQVARLSRSWGRQSGSDSGNLACRPVDESLGKTFLSSFSHAVSLRENLKHPIGQMSLKHVNKKKK